MVSEMRKVAKIIHQVNKAYCEFHGDKSQVDWDDAPENIQQSVINGVLNAITNPNIQPGDSHANWFEFKKLDGWVYGEVKDAEKKTHPCMVPYEDLPEDQKLKDHLFLAIVKACF